jgi:two-component system KDP operon response regulator KdpE
MKKSALIIDDELQIRRLLRVTLESNDYGVHEAETGELGLAEIAFRRPDVVVLDLGLPDLSGIDVLKRLREWSATPVVILSVQDDEDQKIRALDAGADDFVTKPFSAAELMARLRVAQRRAKPLNEVQTFSFGKLVVDLVARRVTMDGERISLSATEYSLLTLFVRHAGRILTHRQILREIWGPKAEEHRHYLRVYVTHLRQKIERDPKNPKLIITEAGIGYRLQAD